VGASLNFYKDEIVLLDGRYDVCVISQTSNQLFTTIKSDILDSDSTGWDVMTNRLTKIQRNEADSLPE
jgi:hypothetical protein